MSEEDIKLLEEMKQNCLTKREYVDSKAERKAQAIENLINRNRELEEKIKKREYRFIDGYFEGGNNQHNVWVSKVKEKIEELDTQIKEFTQNVKDSTGEEKIFWKRQRAELVGARNVLMELMEEE